MLQAETRIKGQINGIASKAILVGSTVPIVLYIKENRNSIVVRNISGVTVYLGGSDVTKSNGLPLFDKEILPLDIKWQSEIFAIADSGTNNEVRIMEV